MDLLKCFITAKYYLIIIIIGIARVKKIIMIVEEGFTLVINKIGFALKLEISTEDK